MKKYCLRDSDIEIEAMSNFKNLFLLWCLCRHILDLLIKYRNEDKSMICGRGDIFIPKKT